MNGDRTKASLSVLCLISVKLNAIESICSQEIFLPLCTLGILIVVKVLPPNPNYPAMTTQRQEGGIFETFHGYKNNTIAVVPNSTETLVRSAHSSLQFSSASV